MSFEVWAQADVVLARLTVEPAATAGWLETTLLEAIGTGVSSPFDLADILGLAPGLILNVLGDLWRAGRISFEDTDVDHEALALTSSGRAAIDRPDGPVKTTAQTTVTEELVVVRLTGRVLPAQVARRWIPPQDADLVVPPLPTDTDVAAISIDNLREELAAAIDTNKAGLRTKYRDKRVRTASLQPALLQNGAERRYVKIVVVAHRSEIDELTISVEDKNLTLRERELATRYLQAALDATPRSNFANRVRERASRVPLKPQGIDRAIQDLHDAINTMPSCPANARQQRHDEAGHLATQIATYAESLAAQEMGIELLTSATAHRNALDKLIQSATTQVVIAVPWIRVMGLEALRDSLLDAFDRGVQVILIWGIDGNADGLGTAEAAWLDAISAHIARSGARGQLLYSRDRGSRSHAKLAVADDRRMVVTSMNFLSNSGNTEVGVVLTAIGDQQSPAISAALQYAYDKAPTPQIAYNIDRVPGAFGVRTSPGVLDVPIPRFTAALTEEGAPAGTVRAWAAAWSEYAADLTKLLNRPNPTVELIADLQHRGVLRNALTESVRRVLVTSDKLTDTALSEDIVALARARAQEGLPIRFRYRSANEEGRPRVDALLGPGDRQHPLVDIDRSSSMHAKIVLRDDRVLLGSFNPLSVDADLRQRRSTGELGVDIRSSEVCDDVWSTITGERSETPTQVPVGPEQVEARSPHASVAQELFEALEAPSPDRVLEVVRRSGFDNAFRAYTAFATDSVGTVRVAAVGLLVDLEQGTSLSASAAALLRLQLRAGNWGVARLLREHTEEADLPTLQFVEAIDDGGGSGEALLYADLSDVDLPQAEYESLAVVDFVAILLGDAQAADSDAFFDAAKQHATFESLDFVETATAYLHRYSILPPSPPGEAAAAADRIAVGWSDASEAVAGLKRYDPKLESGYAFQKFIFRPGGEMAVLESALSARSVDDVVDWFITHVPNRHDEKWFDRATSAAKLGKITDSRRQSFVMWRSRVRRAVGHLRDVVQNAPVEEVAWDVDQTTSLQRLLDAGQALHATRSGSKALPESIVVAELTRLLDWAARRPFSKPTRNWRSGTFVETTIAIAQGSIITPSALLRAIAADIVTLRSDAEAILELARADQFIGARQLAAGLTEAGLLDEEEASELTKEITRLRNEAVHGLREQIDEQELHNEHAGIESEAGPAPRINSNDEGLICAAEQLETYRSLSAQAYVDAKATILSLVVQQGGDMAVGWREYINDLIDAGEFVIAEQALHQRNGNTELPRPRPFARWSWASEDIDVVAEWFLTGGGGAPRGMRERFLPADDDTSGHALITALSSLAGTDPNLGDWVCAVQRLVNDDDEHDSPPQVTLEDGYTYATLCLPYAERLPRLRWAQGDPVKIGVGDPPAPNTLFRLSTEMSRVVGEGAVLDVADLLSLLARRDGSGAPELLDRKLQFLSILCSRLPLEDIIDPVETPARLKESGRKQLAWLLSIIGVQADAAEVDRLRIWAGGHPAVLWSLIDAVREDNARGISGLLERTIRNDALMRGLKMDLGHDEDILMLAIGVLGALEGGCTIPALMGAFEDEWTQNFLMPHRLRLVDVITRLIDKGHIKEQDGLLWSCNCAASRALAEAATGQWMSDHMEAVDPSRFVEARAYDFILDRIRHDLQAAGEILDQDSMQARAHVSLQQRLSSELEFELGELCRRECSDYRSKVCDVEFIPPVQRMPVDAVGPMVWVELLVAELLKNALEAVRGLPPGEGTIWVTLDTELSEPGVAVLRIQNNGNRVPAEIAEAFAEGRVVRRAGRIHRGTGLASFKRFGERHDVTMNLQETPAGETVVECKFPLAVRSSDHCSAQ